VKSYEIKVKVPHGFLTCQRDCASLEEWIDWLRQSGIPNFDDQIQELVASLPEIPPE